MIPEAAVEAAAKAMVRISRWEDVAGSSKMQLMLNARLALEAAAPHMLAEARTKIVAHLEECGGDYDLRYSASIGMLADDLLSELTP